ncbi:MULTISPECIES: DUF3105 domain-containing protein [unclassified Nocardioides]|uniref:DUF3105 domain-containing protein n=1 Tax=Nocardioides sp. URHA0032 TaxID=1380388 RepID=UPI0004905D4F|nr:DUF3105 domain-containing protein [Nocardioides sp. URHA0032]
MAKTTKSDKIDRKAVVEQMRKKQKGADRRRNFAIVGVCVLIAVGILAAAIVPIVKDKLDARKYDNTALSDIGAPASSCQDITTKKADGNQNHVPIGTPVDYTTAPPAFGAHWNEAGVAPAPFAKKFYTADERPELEALVHNLEHGYTILWYDSTIADDSTALDEVKAIADKFSGSSDDMRDKFIAAPWKSTDEDGAKFPDGQHVAFTHWSAGGQGETDPSKQVGAFQYCSAVSGAALEDFMKKYPYFDSPEPGAM